MDQDLSNDEMSETTLPSAYGPNIYIHVYIYEATFDSEGIKSEGIGNLYDWFALSSGILWA